MSSFIDVSCAKCGRKFGWFGTLAGRPACPRCGDRPAQQELDVQQKRHDDEMSLIFSRPDAEKCGRQRVLAGLSLRQAARILDLPPQQLSDIENGRAVLTDEVAEKMASIYGVG